MHDHFQQFNFFRFVAATVLSMNHVNSLKMESESAAPGEKPQFLGVREQRVTHLAIFLMIGLSVLLTPLLKHIPMPGNQSINQLFSINKPLTNA